MRKLSRVQARTGVALELKQYEIPDVHTVCYPNAKVFGVFLSISLSAEFLLMPLRSLRHP
jgi:hypothetical protein